MHPPALAKVVVVVVVAVVVMVERRGPHRSSSSMATAEVEELFSEICIFFLIRILFFKFNISNMCRGRR